MTTLYLNVNPADSMATVTAILGYCRVYLFCCLCIQAQKNHVECVSILLSSAGVNDIADGEGRTALMWAAQRGNYKVLEVMLEKEVNVHAFDNLGGTGMYM